MVHCMCADMMVRRLPAGSGTAEPGGAGPALRALRNGPGEHLYRHGRSNQADQEQ